MSHGVARVEVGQGHVLDNHEPGRARLSRETPHGLLALGLGAELCVDGTIGDDRTGRDVIVSVGAVTAVGSSSALVVADSFGLAIAGVASLGAGVEGIAARKAGVRRTTVAVAVALVSGDEDRRRRSQGAVSGPRACHERVVWMGQVAADRGRASPLRNSEDSESVLVAVALSQKRGTGLLVSRDDGVVERVAGSDDIGESAKCQ